MAYSKYFTKSNKHKNVEKSRIEGSVDRLFQLEDPPRDSILGSPHGRGVLRLLAIPWLPRLFCHASIEGTWRDNILPTPLRAPYVGDVIRGPLDLRGRGYRQGGLVLVPLRDPHGDERWVHVLKCRIGADHHGDYIRIGCRWTWGGQRR